ncbi:hypothetical protein FQN54_002681 [Arachnomyces sp. PD_36]|nr:hypothetical protein FQN54_002681 [Arachnomyces sp. PD_36]
MARPIELNRQTAGLIKRTWVRDSKELACFHKLFQQLLDGGLLEGLSDERGRFHHHPFYYLRNSDSFRRILEDLIKNLESLIPNYFHSLPSPASDDAKFAFVLPYLIEDWPWYSGVSEYGGDDDPKHFHTALACVLSDKKLQYWNLLSAGAGGNLTSSLLQLSQEEVFKQIYESIKVRQATFSCGGSIGIGISDPASSFQSSRPVKIQWSGDGGQLYKISLPDDIRESQTPSGLVPLLSSYPLCRERFCTSFHPADFGIISAIEQLLLPGVDSGSQIPVNSRRVKAELEKLDVRSTALGAYRKDINALAPSQDLLGYLFICLPFSHEGGQLTVGHPQKPLQTTFDWDRLSSSSIQWAAFYSDCDYEISRLSSGHLIMLTYNLYIVDPTGGTLAPNPTNGTLSPDPIVGPLVPDPIVSAASLPPYELLRDALDNPGFMREGGVLGSFCLHPYPHTGDTAASNFPKILKGTDMALFSAFKSLRLNVKVLPVLETRWRPHDPPDEWRFEVYSNECGEIDVYNSIDREYYLHDNSDRQYSMDDLPDDPPTQTGIMIRWINGSDFLRNEGKERRSMQYRIMFEDVDRTLELESLWRVLLLSRVPKTYGRNHGARVGHELHPYLAHECGHSEEHNVVFEHWPSSLLPNIRWLIPSRHGELALTHQVQDDFDDTIQSKTLKSYLAIIAIVPPLAERGVKSNRPVSDEL